MPLRVLMYATLYWERQWLTWKNRHPRAGRLRLSPVLPIIFHTGVTPWDTNRSLAELIDLPELFRPYVPTCQPLLFDLAEHPPEALQRAAGEWLRTMAVVRVERASHDTFTNVYADVVRGLEPLAMRDKMRWHDLVGFLISWGKQRRPQQEWNELVSLTAASHTTVALREEIVVMSRLVEQTWEEWAKEHYTALGETKGALRTCKEDLRMLLEERFGTLPEVLSQRIEAADDLERLRACLRKAVRVESLDEFEL